MLFSAKYAVMFSGLLLLLSATVNGQEFAPLGAEWHYHQSNPFDGVTYTRMLSFADTVVNERTCRELRTYSYWWKVEREPSTFIHQDGRQVYYYAGDSFHLLFDFSLLPGDSVELRNPISSPHIAPTTWYRVDSVVKIGRIPDVAINWLGPDNRSAFYISPMDEGSDLWWPGPIVEGVGGLRTFLPVPTTYTPGFSEGPLRCYSDPTVDYHPYPGPCHEWVIPDQVLQGADTLGTTTRYPAPTVYPNPATTAINFRLPSAPFTAKLFSINGKLLHQQLTADPIDVRHLVPGIYLLKIATAEHIDVHRIVVQ